MKKILLLGSLLVGAALFSYMNTAQAVMFKMLGAGDLGKAADTNGSGAFKGKVVKSELDDTGQSITFQIQDAIRGKIKNGDVITLHFAENRSKSNLRLSMGFPTPQNLTPGSETVLFYTTNISGQTFLIGGDQGQYYITNVGGKPALYNSLGNSNFFSEKEMGRPLMQKVVKGMQESNSGAIPYEEFKKLINN